MNSFPLTYDDFLNTKKQSEPYYFGLGFIKVRLDEKRSMNFYDPELGADLPDEEVHDHRYDFISEILGGGLINQIIQITPMTSNADGEVWSVSCKEGQTDELLYSAGFLEYQTASMAEGSWYSMRNFMFHRVKPWDEGAITGLTRTSEILHAYARVFRPIGGAKVCPYARKIDSTELYSRIEKLYGTLRPNG